MRLMSRLLAVGMAVGATALTGTTTAIAAGIDGQSSTVETLEYPNADKIFEERGIRLKRGDGHIVLVECGSRPGLIQIDARGLANKKGGGHFCFRLTGSSGYLSVELPRAYGADATGSDYEVRVNMITGSQTASWDLSKEHYTSVGETGDPKGREFTLLEIVAQK